MDFPANSISSCCQQKALAAVSQAANVVATVHFTLCLKARLLTKLPFKIRLLKLF